MVQKVKGQLEKSGCRILGAVLNKVNQESKGYYSGITVNIMENTPDTDPVGAAVKQRKVKKKQK